MDGAGRVQDNDRGRAFLNTRKSDPQPVSIQEWLQRAGRLNNVASTKVPAIALRCMQQLASFPRDSIGRSDLSATIQAVNTTLACATAVRAKPRLLSDLGKTLQTQPALRKGLLRSPEFQQHVASLFSLAAADPTSFSYAVNVSQLASAQIKTGHYSAPFWASLERAGLRGLPPRQFANVVYAAAKLHADLGAPRPTPGMQQRVWHAVEAGGHRMTAGMTAQHVSNVWWAFATLDLAIPAATLDVLKAATVRVAPEMAPQNVSNVLWAFASLQVQVDGLVSPLEAAVAAVAPRSNPQGVANMLWAWATLRLPPQRVLRPLLDALPRVVPLMRDQHLANVCWAWGALMLPAAEAMPMLQHGFLRLARDGPVSEQALSNVWWAWARLRVCDDGIAACWHAVLAQHVQHAEPLTTVMVLKAASTLARPLPPQLFMRLMHAVTRDVRSMGVWECSNLLWGLGLMAVVRGGPVGVAVARGGALGGDGDAVIAAYDSTVQHLATRLLEFYDAGAEFAPEALNQVHGTSGVLGLERRLGPAARKFLDACRAASVQRAGVMELREGPPGGAGPANGDEAVGVMGDKHQAVLETLRSIPELSDLEILPEANVGDGSRRADVLLEGRGARLIVEVDGPSHFVTDFAGQTLLRETGSTALRNWQLRDWGYTVLSVPVGNKSCAQLRSQDAAAWLLRGLRSVGAPV